MKDFIKRVALAGIGFAAIGREKVEELARDISKNLDITEEEGKKVAREILDESKKAREDLQKSTRKTVTDVMHSMELPTRDEIKKIEDRLAALEKKSAGSKSTAKSTTRKSTSGKSSGKK